MLGSAALTASPNDPGHTRRGPLPTLTRRHRAAKRTRHGVGRVWVNPRAQTLSGRRSNHPTRPFSGQIPDRTRISDAVRRHRAVTSRRHDGPKAGAGRSNYLPQVQDEPQEQLYVGSTCVPARATRTHSTKRGKEQAGGETTEETPTQQSRSHVSSCCSQHSRLSTQGKPNGDRQTPSDKRATSDRASTAHPSRARTSPQEHLSLPPGHAATALFIASARGVGGRQECQQREGGRLGWARTKEEGGNRRGRVWTGRVHRVGRSWGHLYQP